MQIVGTRAHRPWYARSWFTWPWVWRIASIAAVSLVVYGVWRLPPDTPAVVTTSRTTRIV
jgi:hypothetical protein